MKLPAPPSDKRQLHAGGLAHRGAPTHLRPSAVAHAATTAARGPTTGPVGTGNLARLHSLGLRAKLRVAPASDAAEVQAERLARDFVAGSLGPGMAAARANDSPHTNWHGDAHTNPNDGAGSGSGGLPSTPGLASAKGTSAPALQGPSHPIAPAQRQRFEQFFGADLADVRVHTHLAGQQQARALGAQAFTAGNDIWFSKPEGPGDERLLAHEVAHVALQHEGIRRAPEPSPDPDRADDDLAKDVDEDESLLGQIKRPFVWHVNSAQPDMVWVSADASREEIALALMNDGRRSEDFDYVSPSETRGESYVETDGRGADGKTGIEELAAIRFIDPNSAPTLVRQAMQAVYEKRLALDVQATVDALVSGDDGAVIGYFLHWASASENKDAAGTGYFERYLQALENRSITSSRGIGGWRWSSSSRNALEEALAELQGRGLEMVRKAITLHSTRNVGYTVQDAKPSLFTGDAVGRFVSHEDGSLIRITIVLTLAQASSRDEALIRTRSSDYLGPRVVVPGTDGFFYGYGVQYDTVIGAALPGAERGHFAWYHPGTTLVGAGDFDDTATTLTPQRGFMLYMVGEALQKTTPHDASALYGLDHGVLRLASTRERVDIFRKVLDADATGSYGAIALLTRVTMSMTPEQFRVFERELDAAGLMARLLGIKGSRTRNSLGQLGQAFTLQTMASAPTGPGTFADPTTLELGEDNGATKYFQANVGQAKSHLVPNAPSQAAPTVSPQGQVVEPGLPGEAERDINRTTLSFTYGFVPDTQADSSRWSRRSSANTRAFLPTEMLALEIVNKGKRQRRVVSAFEAAMMQGDPESDAGSKDFSNFLDTVMLFSAIKGVTALGGMAMRAAATGSLRAGAALLRQQLTSQAGKTALRGVADYALLQSAHYIEEHQEELQGTTQGRAFMSLTTAAIAILAVRDFGHLVESGLITKVASAGRELLSVASSALKLRVLRSLRDFRAAQMAWTSLREAGALEMVMVGGLRVPTAAAVAEFGQAFRVAQGRAAGEALLETVRASGGSTARAEAVLGKLESAAGGAKGAKTAAQKDAARAYRDVAETAQALPTKKVDEFLKAVEETLAAGRRNATDMGPALRAAAKAKDPIAALADLRWLAQSPLSHEAFAVMCAKAGRGSVDLVWLRGAAVPKDMLEFMALDAKTPWNLFRDAAQNPANTALQLRALARLRGISAEMVSGETAAAKVPGWRVNQRQVPMGSSEIDFGLKSTDRLGRTRGLEVKGWTRETWKESIEAYPLRSKKPATRTEAQQRALDRIEHMIGQLKDAAGVARSEAPVLSVTGAMRADDLAELRQILKRRVDKPVEIILLDESAITKRSAALRQGLGVPGPQ